MPNIFKPKRSTTASSVPTTGQLSDGELAVNITDKLIFVRNGASVVPIANYSTGGGGGGGTSQWVTTDAGIHTLSNVGIGTTDPTSTLTVAGNGDFTGDINAVGNISGFDINATNSITSPNYNNLYLTNAVPGSGNVIVGEASNSAYGLIGAGSTGDANTLLGSQSGYGITTGGSNTLLGYGAGYSITTSSANISIGVFSLYTGGFDAGGFNNITIGNLNSVGLGVNNQVIIGSGDLLGSNPFYSPNYTKDTQFAVGIRTDVNPAKYWIVGDENFNIGIGTTNPTSKLSVGGNAIITGIATASQLDGSPINTLSGTILAYSYQMAMP